MFVINDHHVGQQWARGTCAHVCGRGLRACVAAGPRTLLSSCGQHVGRAEDTESSAKGLESASRSVLRAPLLLTSCATWGGYITLEPRGGPAGPVGSPSQVCGRVRQEAA